MICPNCDATGTFSTGYFHCDACVEEEYAYHAAEQAAFEAGEAAFLAETEAATVMQSDLTDDQIEEAIAAAEAHYDRTVNR